MKRYYLGVDWSDEFHQVCAIDPVGKKVIEKKVLENVDGLAEFGRGSMSAGLRGSSCGRPSRSRQDGLSIFFWIMG